MSYEITGRICQINETQQVNDRFKKREFVLRTQEEVNGNVYDNYVKCQLLQAKCDLLDNYKVGDNVKALFNIKGNKWERDGQVNYITNIDVWRIEVYHPKSDELSARNDIGDDKGFTPPSDKDDLPF